MSRLLAPDYIQHNPAVPTGAQPILDLLPALADSGITPTIHRVLTDGNMVALHTTYENADLFGAPTLIGFDVFRIEYGRVAEHWDNLQVPMGPNPSGHTMTDGPTEIDPDAPTAANRAHVVDFMETALIGGDFADLTNWISAETYIQHNPDIANGLDGLAEAFAAFAEQGLEIAYSEIHLVVAEGDFVLVGSEGTLGGAPTAFHDMFRLEDGLIVEHWDVISAIPDTMAHDNGKF